MDGIFRALGVEFLHERRSRWRRQEELGRWAAPWATLKVRVEHLPHECVGQVVHDAVVGGAASTGWVSTEHGGRHGTRFSATVRACCWSFNLRWSTGGHRDKES